MYGLYVHHVAIATVSDRKSKTKEMKDDDVYNLAEERDIGYRANYPVCICINIYVLVLSFTFSVMI